MALLMIMKGLGTLYGGDRPTCCVHVHLSKLTCGRQSQEGYQFYGVNLHCMSVIIFHLLPVFVVCKSCHFLTQVIGSQQAVCDCEFVQPIHSAYSLHLAPSDYSLMRNLNYHLRGTWFTADESLTIAMSRHG